ncbi:Predicted arabinose efflux permease, MFS family [Amycolatopsis marina]|uniref:Predicted arabinose efflux permease, MFS family n=1 Tax=Amycolatopsis marina TaxID=490629 RepID=A0A1I0WU95_9PSEU|nr:MFS transporter [Amycolatopsis marina]SFA92342.1 Predicted arabinose efflux permease, MFS family [Amycolatopsis marina]
MSAGLTEPLRHRNFRALTGGRTATELGNAIAPVALAFVVLDLTGSVVDLGIVVGARSVANVLLVLLGGMLADRLPRSFILQGTTLLAAVTQAAIAVSVLSGFATIPLLVALSFVNGAAAALSLPAAASLTPQTVPGSLLTQANALVRIGSNSGRITGLALGGVLVAAMGSGWTIGVNAALFLLASACYRGVRLPVAVRTERARPLAELAEGWREFAARTWVWVVVAQFMVVNAVIAGCVVVLGPAIADETIGRGAWGFVLAAQTAGAFAGGFLAARWRPRHLLRIGVAVIVVEAIPMLTLAWAPAVIPLLVAMFTAGVAIEQFVVAWDVSLQENIPQDRLARVYSYDMLGSFIALPAGEVAAGPLAERFGTAVTLTGGAILIVLTTGAALLCQDIRTLSRTSTAPVP